MDGSEAEGAGLDPGAESRVGCRSCSRCSGLFGEVRSGAASAMMIHGFQSSHQDFSFGPWKLTAAKTHIMKSADVEK